MVGAVRRRKVHFNKVMLWDIVVNANRNFGGGRR